MYIYVNLIKSTYIYMYNMGHTFDKSWIFGLVKTKDLVGFSRKCLFKGEPHQEGEW